MAALEHLYLDPFLVFTLVLARLGALLMTTPVFGTPEVPRQARVFLALGMALVITPTQLPGTFAAPQSVIDLIILVANDALVGLLLGLGLMVLVSGVQVAGQVISQISGISLADVFNPGFDADVPVFSQLLYFVTLAAFVIVGGHRKLLEALLGTFQAMPPGRAAMSDSIGHTVTTLATQSFVLGIRAAAPAMIALLLATLVLGLISRVLPQLNIMTVGYGLNSMITLAALSVSLAAIVWLFQNEFDPALETILDGLQKSPR